VNATSPAATPTRLTVGDANTLEPQRILVLPYSAAVFTAADGVEALDLLAQIEPPDAIVLDVMMPRVDGFELARRIKADPKLHRVPILYLTAKTGALDIIAGINAGARHYLTKPFKLPDLLARLGGMVGPRA